MTPRQIETTMRTTTVAPSFGAERHCDELAALASANKPHTTINR